MDTYFEAVGKKFSKASIYHLGLTVLEILEQIHAAGYVYNDLKLDNLLIGFHDQVPGETYEDNCFKNCTINLVDFGFATRYLEKKQYNNGSSQKMHI